MVAVLEQLVHFMRHAVFYLTDEFRSLIRKLNCISFNRCLEHRLCSAYSQFLMYSCSIGERSEHMSLVHLTSMDAGLKTERNYRKTKVGTCRQTKMASVSNPLYLFL